MSGRCVSCNSILTKVELQINKEDGSPEDMCGDCRDVVYDDSYVHEFLFEDLTEGLTLPKRMNNY